MTEQLRAGQAPDLTTDRLRLVRVGPRHVDAITALAGDLEVARWLSRVPHPYRRADAVAFIDEVVPHEVAWGIEMPDGSLAGIGGFAFRPDPPDVSLGYWLGRPFWGRGLATEAARLMLAHAWACDVPQVHSRYFEGNTRSSNVLRKLGFRETGRSSSFNEALGAERRHVDLAIERPSAA